MSRYGKTNISGAATLHQSGSGEDKGKRQKRLYCIEGHWDYNYDWGEPSVEPLLQTIQATGGRPYIRRNSATVLEMHYWLKTEWWENCANGSILYIASHGGPGQIWLSNRKGHREVESLSTLADRAENEHFAQRFLVHFGGCHVLNISDDEIDAFLDRSGAYAVSGHTEHAGWTAENKGVPPSLALELMFFSSIWERDINLGNHTEMLAKLPPLVEEIKKRIKKCGFRLRTRPKPLPRAS